MKMDDEGSGGLCGIVHHYFWLICVLAILCGLVAFRRFMKGVHYESSVKLNGKTVLITGANTGIGKETAVDLAKRGARVLLACRDLTKAEHAAAEIRQSTGNPDVVVYTLDLTSLASVRQCACDVIAQEHRLDVLINNAGVAITPYMKTVDGFELQLGTNHLGHFLLTNLLLGLLKTSAPSRIVNVSSNSHAWVKKFNVDELNVTKHQYRTYTAYANSKLCNVLFARELSKRLHGTSVTANSLHPGCAATEVARHIFTDTFPAPVGWCINLSYNLLTKRLMKTPLEGAQTSIYCAVAPELDGVTGRYFSECAIARESALSRDEKVAAKLWDWSEQMVGI